MNKSTIASLVIVLIIGLALGSVVFPRTAFQVTTQVTTLIILNSSASSGQYVVVTPTVQPILAYPVVATCTTISGRATTIFVDGYLGQYTTVTTIYPPNLPSEYIATVTTATTYSGSAYTENYTASC